jgi:hypothetical protein
MAISLNQRISDCGKQFAIAAAHEYASGSSLHPTTLIAACARTAGAQFLQSTALLTADMVPGTPLLAPPLNAGTPLLLRVCAAVLASLGHQLPSQPTTSLSEDFKYVREHFLESHQRLAAIAEELKQQYELDAAQMARCRGSHGDDNP